ncbi:MAG: hypothetical protein Q8Q08_00810 [Candidatus Omnitrophota bacterium]|nr:hypothetical protein [Candidatus Omnitrophota bacterium]MDZ4242292.1 hypothetical protein [Candidatus Omnitrophota bacterium]
MTSHSLSPRILYGLFLLSLVTLVFELLISRVMSVIAWYHFSFMAICLALFGLTLGAVIVHKYKDAFLKNYSSNLRRCAAAFSSALLINLTIVCQLPAFVNSSASGDWQITYRYWNILWIFASTALPLISSGVGISLIFTRYAGHANKIYFINLLGSSLGCLLFIPLINSLEVINSYFILALAGVVTAILFDASAPAAQRKTKHLVGLLLFLAIALCVNLSTDCLKIRWTKGQLVNQAFYKKWNSFSYIRLFEIPGQPAPIGWGFAPKKQQEVFRNRVKQMYLDIDSIAGTHMTDFEQRDFRKIDFLKYDITSLAHYLVTGGDMLVIGVGAGRDVLAGLLFGQKTITGVEINEAILNIHKKVVPHFTGDLSHHPKVTLVHNEARSFINASDKKFDLIQLSLIDTFAATQAGAYALTENSLYTTGAFHTYWDHLTESGVLSVSYWMPLESPEHMLRMLGAATESLMRDGVLQPRAHFVLVHTDGLFEGREVGTLLVKKSPFSAQELHLVKNYCETMGFHLILSPAGSHFPAFREMSDPTGVREYPRHYFRNITPATDDKPFFFLLSRFDTWEFVKQLWPPNFSAEHILFSLLGLMTILTILFVILPLCRMQQPMKLDTTAIPLTVYFSTIGIAFMFVEMSQVTRLSSFLGHPIYSLSITLFSFLLGSGLGSFFLGRVDTRRGVTAYSMLFLTIAIGTVLFMAPALSFFSRHPIGTRMIASIVVVLPLGFFMGSFLPQGIRILDKKNGPIALFWGLNGAMSVIGSILAMIAQITLGLNTTFLIGVVLYALAIHLLLKMKFTNC